MVTKLQQRIDSRIYVVIVLDNLKKPIKQLTKALTDMKLWESEVKKIQIEVQNTKPMLANKKEHFQSTQANV